MMNRMDREKGEARLRFLDGDFEVLQPGAYVVCAVTGIILFGFVLVHMLGNLSRRCPGEPRRHDGRRDHGPGYRETRYGL